MEISNININTCKYKYIRNIINVLFTILLIINSYFLFISDTLVCFLCSVLFFTNLYIIHVSDDFEDVEFYPILAKLYVIFIYPLNKHNIY